MKKSNPKNQLIELEPGIIVELDEHSEPINTWCNPDLYVSPRRIDKKNYNNHPIPNNC